MISVPERSEAKRIVEVACASATLVDALTFVAEWETTRILRSPRPASAETLYPFLFAELLEAWSETHPIPIRRKNVRR